ncbi:glutamate-gated chloride channel-like, partial [Saccoglossus kowalevskii]|uniref:Glutamate-gated chloride channel-like n=1 Tax=Saccoglossus kowalevskii TaxID=10224 RepID=A0ABM0MNN3_SACKO
MVDVDKVTLVVSEYKTKVWIPDLNFEDSKRETVHSLGSQSHALQIASDGIVWYSFRVSLTLSCNLYLLIFPLDTQLCELKLLSYSYNTEGILLNWEDPVFGVTLYDKILMPQYNLDAYKIDKFNVNNGRYGEWSCLGVQFLLSRRVGYFLVSHYVISCLKVSSTWLSFWLPLSSPPARVSLIVSCLLALNLQNSMLHSDLPSLSYPTAMDVWLFLCMVFVFASLIETVIAISCDRRKANTSDKPRRRGNLSVNKKVCQ